MKQYIIPPACLVAAIATAHITSQPIQTHDPETFIQTGRLAIVERPNPAAGFGKLLSLGFLGGFIVSTHQLLFKKETEVKTNAAHQPQAQLTQAVRASATPAIAPAPEPAPVQWDEDPDLEAYDPEPVETSDPYEYTKDLLHYPSILLWGGQGAGKTSAAGWIVKERCKLGHKVTILDPHREFGQWEGLACVGDGMDYEAIDAELLEFTETIKFRYKERAKRRDYKPRPITFVADEFTQWGSKCKHAAKFFEEAVTDIRKINMHVIFIAHSRSMTALGGSKGLSATRDAGLFEFNPIAKLDEATGKAKPSGKGRLRYPGEDQWLDVSVPKWLQHEGDFSEFVTKKSNVVQLKKTTETEEDLWA